MGPYLEYFEITPFQDMTISIAVWLWDDGAGELQRTSSPERFEYTIDNQICIEHKLRAPVEEYS